MAAADERMASSDAHAPVGCPPTDPCPTEVRDALSGEVDRSGWVGENLKYCCTFSSPSINTVYLFVFSFCFAGYQL